MDLVTQCGRRQHREHQFRCHLLRRGLSDLGAAQWTENNFLGGVRASRQPGGLQPQAAGLALLHRTLDVRKRWLGGVSLNFEHAVRPKCAAGHHVSYLHGDESEAFPDPYLTYAQYQAAIDAGEKVPSQYTMNYTVLESFSAGVDTGYRYFTRLAGSSTQRIGALVSTHRVRPHPAPSSSGCKAERESGRM